MATADALMKTLEAIIPTYDFSRNMKVQLAAWAIDASPQAIGHQQQNLAQVLKRDLSLPDRLAVVQTAALIELLALAKRDKSAGRAFQLRVQGTDDVLRFALAMTSSLVGPRPT